MCTAPAKRQPPASDADMRRNSARRLCDCACQQPRELLGVLRLPSKGSRGPSGAHARHCCPRTLCLLAPTQRRSSCGCSVYCACHTRHPRPQRRPRAPQIFQDGMCTAPATRKAARRPRSPQLAQRLCVLCAVPQLSGCSRCTVPATPKAALSPVSHTRAAAPPGSFVYCAFHRKTGGEVSYAGTESHSVSE